MKYRGQMPTSLLTDRQIRPIQFRKWDDARRDFTRRDKDRALVEELKASIRSKGLRKPILLGVSDRYPDVYVGDGHHRAVALMELGIESFAFHWYWIKGFGVRMEHEPFPYHLLGL
ncbi:ParB/RepB/Spo0J family partition protein [Streptomyces syringium]|uniref:ParB/RepB/Spo0J family partition protein n=1 Tax=Streptomyces syringium TaxID=76729 RepID=UPI00365F54CC